MLQTDGSTIMRLEIPHMYSEMYRTHYLVAENELGSTEHAIKLIEGLMSRFSHMYKVAC